MKKNRLLALILVCSLVMVLFAGCGNEATSTEAAASTVTEADSSEAEVSASEDVTEEAESEEVTSAQEETSAEEDVIPNAEGSIPGRTETVELPLTDEKVTITAFHTVSFSVSNFMEDLNENATIQKIEELTNIHFDYTNTPNDAAETNFQLMIVGGDYTDIIESGDIRYADGADAAVEADVFLDLTDLLKEYAPNYLAVVDHYGLQRDCTTDEGKYVAIYGLYDDYSPQTYGPFIRSDYLEQVGMDIPETYDDYEAVLTAFKNELGLSEPLSLGGAGVPNGNYLVAGFGICGYAQLVPKVIAPYMQIDDKVVYGAYTQEFKEYLTMMHDWYEKGLISSNFMSNHPLFYNSDGVVAGDIGVFYTNMDDAQSLVASNDNIRVSAIPDPVKNAGDKLHVGGSKVQGKFSDGGFVVTTAATDEEVELYLGEINYLFSEEGSLLADYGVEGLTYELDENGDPWPTDLILNNPDGLNEQQAKAYYIAGVGLTSAVKEYQKVAYDEGVVKGFTSWTENLDYAYYLPETLAVSSEDAYEYNSMYTDISTYVSEMTLKFITGDESLDEYDAYINQLTTMGIEDCIEIMQRAYDNYLSK